MSLVNENQTTGHNTGHVTGQDKILEFCKQSRSIFPGGASYQFIKTKLDERLILLSEEWCFSFMQRVLAGVNEALSMEGPVLIMVHGGIHWAMCCFMQIEHDWIIDNCVPVHFYCIENSWRARKLKQREEYSNLRETNYE